MMDVVYTFLLARAIFTTQRIFMKNKIYAVSILKAIYMISYSSDTSKEQAAVFFLGSFWCVIVV